MKKDDKTFLDKFNELTNQMTDLVKCATDEDLENIGIKRFSKYDKEAPSIPLEPKNNKEFIENMVHRLTGNKDTFIIQKADEVTEFDVLPYVESKRPITTPSVIKPSGSVLTFNPYITFFTTDGKLAMLPYEGEFFSDTRTFEGKVDPLTYRR